MEVVCNVFADVQNRDRWLQKMVMWWAVNMNLCKKFSIVKILQWSVLTFSQSLSSAEIFQCTILAVDAVILSLFEVTLLSIITFIAILRFFTRYVIFHYFVQFSTILHHYQELMIIIVIIMIINSIGSVVNHKWKNTVDVSNLKIETPHTALKSTLWPLFEYITAYLIQLVSFCGPVVHT